ncbi:hypothetical protein Tco_0169021 [Tanacetum coccineum]
MPNTRDVDHHDTAIYIPLYHRTSGFTGNERDIYKSLVYRLFHEGRVVLPDFLEDEPNLRPTFGAIGFTIDNVETILTLENFAQILKIPYEGVCLYSHEWFISSLQRSLDPHPNLYPHHIEDPSLVRDALFKEIPEPILRKIKGDNETLEPFQMLNTEFKDTFNKWYLILNENVICLTELRTLASYIFTLVSRLRVSKLGQFSSSSALASAHCSKPVLFGQRHRPAGSTVGFLPSLRFQRFKPKP